MPSFPVFSFQLLFSEPSITAVKISQEALRLKLDTVYPLQLKCAAHACRSSVGSESGLHYVGSAPTGVHSRLVRSSPEVCCPCLQAVQWVLKAGRGVCTMWGQRRREGTADWRAAASPSWGGRRSLAGSLPTPRCCLCEFGALVLSTL